MHYSRILCVILNFSMRNYYQLIAYRIIDAKIAHFACNICALFNRKKNRPSTSQLITGVPPVTSTAGSPVSDHSGK